MSIVHNDRTTPLSVINANTGLEPNGTIEMTAEDGTKQSIFVKVIATT